MMEKDSLILVIQMETLFIHIKEVEDLVQPSITTLSFDMPSETIETLVQVGGTGVPVATDIVIATLQYHMLIRLLKALVIAL